MEGYIYHTNASGYVESTRYAGAIPQAQGRKVLSAYDETVTFFNLAPSHHDDDMQYAFVDGKLVLMTEDIAYLRASQALQQLMQAIEQQPDSDAHIKDLIEDMTPLAMLVCRAEKSSLLNATAPSNYLSVVEACNDWIVFSAFLGQYSHCTQKMRLAVPALLTLHLMIEFEGGVEEAFINGLPIFSYHSDNLYYADYSKAIQILRG